MNRYGKISLGLIAVWFLAAVVAAGVFHIFQSALNQLGAAVGMAATLPILLFVAWFAGSKGFREFAMGLSARRLTLLQTGRVMGLVFVVLGMRGVLPTRFAWPAGYGDAFIGLTAWLVAWKLSNAGHRGSFILWQGLGILDLVTAVGLGVTTGLVHPEGLTMGAITVLPLSLIPTFFVPLYFIFHLICVAQARGWGSAAPTGLRKGAVRLSAAEM
ncbi:MAG TPA: hypothetical protein VGD60_10650 [Candidatus Acidoferrales bacterium]